MLVPPHMAIWIWRQGVGDGIQGLAMLGKGSTAGAHFGSTYTKKGFHCGAAYW